MKPVLIELKTGRFQKAVFEIIEIEKYKSSVELTYRMADGEIKVLGSFELNVRQTSYGPAENLFRGLRADHTEQSHVTHIFLDICHGIIACRIHLRHRYPFKTEMGSHRNECPVFIRIHSDDTYTG